MVVNKTISGNDNYAFCFNKTENASFQTRYASQNLFICVNSATMRILKFGGSTMRSPSDCEKVVEVIRAAHRKDPAVVVVSALYGVTNLLDSLVKFAISHKISQCRSILKKIRFQHENVSKKTLSVKEQKIFCLVLEQIVEEITELCAGISKVDECSPRTRDRLLGFGELLSSALIASLSRTHKLPAIAVDARALLVTDDNHGQANVNFTASQARVRAAAKSWKNKVPVITGFIGATEDGIPTTIGRNGSDYTGSLVGSMLRCNEIQIWTDVTGVMSADPTEVNDAFTLPHLTYVEAMEMAYFGAKVLHPQSVIPAIEAKVPLRILNINEPDSTGTLITEKRKSIGHTVKGITAIRDMALVSLEGAGMLGVTGVAGRMFAGLAGAEINAVLISQGSSEQSICCVVPSAQAEQARDVLRKTFVHEFKRKQIRRVEIRANIAVIAVVGNGMRGTPGISGRLFTALGKNHINVIAVAQGSSEQNISLVINESDRAKALNVIHGAFHLALQHVHVLVIGKGTIGGKLLEQFGESESRLEKEHNLRLHVVGIADSKRIIFHEDGLSLSKWKKQLANSKEKVSATTVSKHLEESRLANTIIVDATSNEEIAKQYPEWLAKGISVVTPNKKACTMPQNFYDKLQEVVRRRNSYYLYETCVGAGLPVISTLQDLIDSGDKVISIEAMLSGTLGYLFSELENDMSFSQVVRAALKLGYTEPDPRDDLSGMDVARKLLILARKTGERCSLEQVKVEPLLPRKFYQGTIEQFLKRVEDLDSEYSNKVQAAAKKGNVLRYIGRIANGKCKVELSSVPKNSPFGSLQGGDNLVIFTTERYRNNPLIVRGPGAGPDVTAGGVFADVLKVAHLLTTI